MSLTDTARVPLLELRGVGFHRQQTDILRGVDWAVLPGQRCAVLGPNGSGKTTLLRIATGFLWPTQGAVLRLGEELIDLAQLRSQIGWVSADLMNRVPPNEPALATVVSGRRGQVGLRRIGGADWPTATDHADARALLGSMGILSLAEKPVRVLSQGERLQVLVARARMTDAVLLVLDEPCAGMDPGVRERFLTWLGERMKGPTVEDPTPPAIVMTTHHVEEVLPEFDRALLMAAGRVVAQGRPDEVLTEPRLETTYGVGLARIEAHAGRRWPIWHADRPSGPS